MQSTSPEAPLPVPQAQEEFERLFQLSAELLSIAGLDGYFQRLNPAWEQVLGFPREDLLSAPYLDFVYPDDRAITAAEMDKLSTGSPAISFENRYRCRDGSYKWLLWNARFDPGRRRIFASARDITLHKQAEQRLAAGLAVSRILADSPCLAEAAPRLLQAIGEAFGWEMGVFQQAAPNRGEMSCRITWHSESLRAGSLETFRGDAAPGPDAGLLERVRSEDRPIRLAGPGFSLDAAAAGCGLRSAIAFPVRQRGEVTGVMEFFGRQIGPPDANLLFLLDSVGSQIGQFVERRQSERQVRDYAASLEETRREQDEVGRRLARLAVELDQARREAENGDRAKSEFLARMSHEIRTPMTAIMGMTELALRTPLSAEQREYLETVEESSNALLGLINNILDFSRIEAGRLELDPVEFALRETVETAAGSLAARAHGKQLELTCEIRKDVPDSLIGDPCRLRQILLNLLGNAIKFTSQGGIVVQVKRETGRAGADGEVLHFAVRDTGIGVPAEIRNAIFDSFAQADTSLTRRYGGTGLGLTIAAQLVTLMGGRIWVESGRGRGSTFHFTARFRRAARRARTGRMSLPKNLRGLPVLVVDDSQATLRALVRILRDWGLQARGAGTGRDAFALAQRAAKTRRPFRLLLLDADLPQIDGVKLAGRIRRLPSHRDAGLVLLTSGANPAGPGRTCRTEPATRLDKPVKQSELWDAVLSGLPGNPPPSRRSAPARPRRASTPLSILVAEDNPVNQKLILLLIRKMGHRAVVARNGQEAVAAAGRRKIDLALMDVEMPVLSGLDATRRIRQGETVTNTHLPIIAMTAHALKGDAERCRAAGMDAYLSKPIRLDEFSRTVRLFAPAPAVSRKAARPGRRRSGS